MSRVLSRRGATIAATILALAVPVWSRVAGAETPVGANQGTEEISRFDVALRLERHGELDVTETIKVVSAQKAILRGIYRDLPLGRVGPGGKELKGKVEVLAVLRDGQPEEYRQERKENQIRVYIGTRNATLEKGIHTYTLRYRAERRVDVESQEAILHWVVTGQRWDFPIQVAQVSLELPIGSDRSIVAGVGYTGIRGSAGADYRMVREDERLRLFTSDVLEPGEEFSATFTFPSKVLAPPTEEQRREWFYQEHGGDFFIAVLVGISTLYLLLAWVVVGRSPSVPVVTPVQSPPKGHSPGGMRFVERMRYDSRCLAADILHLAVEGHLRIIQRGKEFELRSLDPANEPVGHLALLKKGLFESGRFLPIKGENKDNIRKARMAHRRSLTSRYVGSFFKRNTWVVILAWLAVPIEILFLFAEGTSWLGGCLVGLVIILNIACVRWMRRPTEKGQTLRAETEGFRQFLAEAESSAPGVGDGKYLPYAVALGVESDPLRYWGTSRNQGAPDVSPWLLDGSSEMTDLLACLGGALSSYLDSSTGGDHGATTHADGGDGGGW